MLCLDGEPAKDSRYVLLEHAESDAVGQEEANDIEEEVDIVVLEVLVCPRRWVDQRLCQVVDLSERQRRLAVFFLDLLDHESS